MELHLKLVCKTFNQPERQAKLLALRLFRSLGTDKLEAALRGGGTATPHGVVVTYKMNSLLAGARSRAEMFSGKRTYKVASKPALRMVVGRGRHRSAGLPSLGRGSFNSCEVPRPHVV